VRLFIIIPVHDRIAFTRLCLDSVAQQGLKDRAVVVIDDGSADGTWEALAQDYPFAALLMGDGSLWWAGAMNVGVAWALTQAGPNDLVLSLNNDTVLPPGYLQGLLRAHAVAPRALIGSLQVDLADQTTIIDGGVHVRWATAKFCTSGRGAAVPPEHLEPPDLRPVDVLNGCGTLIPAAVFRSIGPYLDKRLRHYAADYEFSRRAARAGFGLYVDWASTLYVREAETGIHAAVAGAGLTRLLRTFWDVRSANDFRVRWRFAAAACPRWALPSYLACDYSRVVVGSVRRYLDREQAASS
jgi:GT2 family glycosyltransferase